MPGYSTGPRGSTACPAIVRVVVSRIRMANGFKILFMISFVFLKSCAFKSCAFKLNKSRPVLADQTAAAQKLFRHQLRHQLRRAGVGLDLFGNFAAGGLVVSGGRFAGWGRATRCAPPGQIKLHPDLVNNFHEKTVYTP